MLLKILRIPFEIDSKMVPNSWKIDLCGCLGALWGPSWRQDGPRATPRPEIAEKYAILGWPIGSKMKLKSIQNLVKNHLDFCNDSETCFFDFGTILTPKTSPKSMLSGSLFQPCCEYARSVILNNPPSFLLYLSSLEA